MLKMHSAVAVNLLKDMVHLPDGRWGKEMQRSCQPENGGISAAFRFVGREAL
jgi:hypothetical protein